MTATMPDGPIVYGHDSAGRPAAISMTGPRPHVLLTGDAGSGLTTLVGVIAAQAASCGRLVRACQPAPAGDDSRARGVPGLTVGRGPGETVRLISEARAEIYTRLAAIASGADPASFPPALLAIDDYQYLARGLAGGSREAARIPLDVEEIIAFGRAARVTLLIATHVMQGLAAGLLHRIGTRIILGPASAITALQLLGDAAAGRAVPGTPGAGTAKVADGPPIAIQVLPAPGSTRLTRRRPAAQA